MRVRDGSAALFITFYPYTDIMATPEKSNAAEPVAKAATGKKNTVKKAPAKKPAAEKKPTQPKKVPAATAPVVAEKKASAANTATQKPVEPKKPTKGTVPAKAQTVKPIREPLTPEEKARVAKFRATLALLKADPEWPTFVEERRVALTELRAGLVPNMQNVTRDHLRSGASNVSSSSGQHIGDAGSEAEVRDLTIRLLDKDREQLFEIDAALERIRRGTYGICEISLDPIPKGRLRVRPFCRLTVKCQEEYEKKYGAGANYRAKNSDRVGFSGLQNDIENAISLDDGEE